MPEINDGKGIKTIAYYLPQYHAIPENDKFYGKGFTEWTNVKKAEPQFEGHYQPRIPLDSNYYCLLDDDVKIWQSELAQKYGLWGFCYYHYWFKDGKKLLEKPLEQMLVNKNVTIPFCLCWANENWSKRWDGGNNEVIVAQDYGTEDGWEKHFEYLFQFFKDERYITLDGKPILLIYKPEEIPNVDQMIEYWDKKAQDKGLQGICFMIQNSSWFFKPSYEMGSFSYQIKFYPFFGVGLKGTSMKKLRDLRKTYKFLKKLDLLWAVEVISKIRRKHIANKAVDDLVKFDYDELWEIALASETSNELIEGAFTDWDNTPRKKKGFCCVGASPLKFEKYMGRLLEKVKTNNQKPVIFINAWNEWGEGAYLEPDEKFQYEYLKALARVLK